MVPTGNHALDAALGGGLPAGITFVRGPCRTVLRTFVQDGACAEFSFAGVFPSLPPFVLPALKPHPIVIVNPPLDSQWGWFADSMRNHLFTRHLFVLPTDTVVPAHTREANVILDASDAEWRVEKWPYPKVPPPFTLPELTTRRVIRALERDPNLAWAVVRGLKVLGPWTAEHGGSVRYSTFGTAADVRGVRDEWIATVGTQRIPAGSEGEAQLLADVELLAQGWILATEDP